MAVFVLAQFIEQLDKADIRGAVCRPGIVQAAARLLMVASPQFLRPTPRAEHAAHQIGPVGLAGDELPGRH